ncbi:MAG: putative signal transducing protein [Candidatus Acidiferrales bacterium]
MVSDHSQEKTVVIHSAGSATEAMVIRGLLESAGISAPGSSSTTDPFPMGDPVEGSHGSDVIVLESQADEARRIIAEYLKSNEGIEIENPENPGS